jgi:antitoxin VapB
MTARIFRNGRNQAIRIPVELSFDTKTVTLEKRGEALIIRPKRERGWDRYFNDPAMVLPADFETGDDPPAPERSLF